jgi:dienelactone hydrolase
MSVRSLVLSLLAGALSLGAGHTLAQTAPEPVISLGPGMVGMYFAPPSGRGQVLLVLGGSEGGLQGSGPLARKLAEHGFGALALSYFGGPGQPQALENIPLETLEAGVDWVRSRPGLGARPLAVVGVSKGGEAALLLASRDPRLCAVVAGVPSSVVWAGIDMAHPMVPVTVSSWSQGGKSLPFVPYAEGPFRGVRDLYERSLVKAAPEAAIPVEKIKGPILLISGKSDQLWPSTPMSETVMARLEAKHFAYAHSHLAYDNAGHAAFGPPLAADSPNMSRLASLGGTAAGNQAARADNWPKTLAFLDQAFAGKSCR